GGVAGDGHELVQDGPGRLEADGFAVGLPGQPVDLLGRAAGIAAEPADGLLEGVAADGLDPVGGLGRGGQTGSGPLGNVVLLGPVADGGAPGQGQGELDLAVLGVRFRHAVAIAAPLAVLDPVRGRPASPRRAEEMRRAGRSVLPWLDADGARRTETR